MENKTVDITCPYCSFVFDKEGFKSQEKEERLLMEKSGVVKYHSVEHPSRCLRCKREITLLIGAQIKTFVYWVDPKKLQIVI